MGHRSLQRCILGLVSHSSRARGAETLEKLLFIALVSHPKTTPPTPLQKLLLDLKPEPCQKRPLSIFKNIFSTSPVWFHLSPYQSTTTLLHIKYDATTTAYGPTFLLMIQLYCFRLSHKNQLAWITRKQG